MEILYAIRWNVLDLHLHSYAVRKQTSDYNTLKKTKNQTSVLKLAVNDCFVIRLIIFKKSKFNFKEKIKFSF